MIVRLKQKFKKYFLNACMSDIALFVYSGFGWLQLGGRLVRSLPTEGWQNIWKRIPLFLFMWFILGVLGLMHGIGFLLDNIFFSGYRQLVVNKPVFIIGIPRSGTTHLQRVLAHDKQFTTLTLWECLFAPSISERYLWSNLTKLLVVFKRVLMPLVKPVLPQLSRGNILAKMDRIHHLGLNEPEEDFLLLLFQQACFLYVVPCPDSDYFWKFGQFDKSVSPHRRMAVLTYYKRCLQRHLYVHGADRRILSKNPSFTSFVESLRGQFPSALFIACTREPLQAVPSQLSSLVPAFGVLGSGEISSRFRTRILEVLHLYYAILGAQSERNDFIVLSMPVLKDSLEAAVLRLYKFMELDVDQKFADILRQKSEKSEKYRSEHAYNLEDFDIDGKLLHEQFADVWPISGIDSNLEVQ